MVLDTIGETGSWIPWMMFELPGVLVTLISITLIFTKNNQRPFAKIVISLLSGFLVLPVSLVLEYVFPIQRTVLVVQKFIPGSRHYWLLFTYSIAASIFIILLFKMIFRMRKDDKVG